jgi:Mce-associated membrane protein
VTSEPDEIEMTGVELTTPEDGVDDAAVAAEPENRVVRWLIPVLLAVLLAGSAGFATWAYFDLYVPDRQTNAMSSDAVLKAASEGAVAMLSYAPETMDKDFAKAKSHLTGDFLGYYTDFTQKVVTPAVKQKDVKTQATVARAAVSEMHPDSALVLAFINQVTVSKENPDGSFAQSAVKISMNKVDGNWLIAAFDPI